MSGPSLLVAETTTGRITDVLDHRDGVTGLRWSDTLNAAGSIDSVTIPMAVVRDLQLRDRTHGMRCSLAVERDGALKQAGPITGRAWNWEKGELTLSAGGLWTLLDKRVIYNDNDYPSGLRTFSNVSLGGLAVSLVQDMLNRIPPYTNLPIVLPAIESGDHTESFARWALSRYGEQLRQITQRAVDAPDIHFQARRRGDDPRYLEWVMQVGSELMPSLSQGGPDWVFDTSAPKSPVLGISTDEDASSMATASWVSGGGQEADMKLTTGMVDDDLTLLNNGWPYMEVDEAHPTISDYTTLLDYAAALAARAGRPIEVFKVQVTGAAAAEVHPGDYARVITAGDVWLGDMDRTMRVKTVSGDLSDVVTLDMFPMQGLL